MPTLRLAVDSARAKTGADQYNRAIKRGVIDPSKQADKSVGRVDKSMNAFSKTAARAAKSVGVLFAGFLGIAGVKAATTVISKFEETMATVQGVTGATAREFRELEATAKGLGATTRFTATEAGEGLLFMARAGFEAVESMRALPSVLNLAIAGQLGLGEAADFASNILSQFNIQAAETNRIVDVLVKTANSSNTNVRQLAEAMKFAGPIAGALGKTVEDAAAAIGVLGNSGIQASQAGTNLRGVMLALAGPTGAAADAIQQLGLALDQVDPEKNGLITIFRRLANTQLDAASATEIFGRRNAAAALILRGNVDTLIELTNANERAAGEAKKLADIQNKTLAGSFRSVVSAVEALVLHMGSGGFLTVLKAVVNTTADAIRLMAGMTAEMVEAGAAAQILAFALKAAGIALGVLVGRAAILGLKSLVAHIVKVTTAMIAARRTTASLSAMLAGRGATAAATPWGLAAVGFGLLAVGAIELISVFTKAAVVTKRLSDAIEKLNMLAEEQAETLFNLARARAAEDLERQARLIGVATAKYIEQNAALVTLRKELGGQSTSLAVLAQQTGKTVDELSRIPAVIKDIEAAREALRSREQKGVGPEGSFLGGILPDLEDVTLPPQIVDKLLKGLINQVQKGMIDLSAEDRKIRMELDVDIVAPAITNDAREFMATIRREIDAVTKRKIELGVKLNSQELQQGSIELRKRLAIAKALNLEEVSFKNALEDESRKLGELRQSHIDRNRQLHKSIALIQQLSTSENRTELTKDILEKRRDVEVIEDQLRAQNDLLESMRKAGPARDRIIELITKSFVELAKEEAVVKALTDKWLALNKVLGERPPIAQFLADLEMELKLLKETDDQREISIALLDLEAAAKKEKRAASTLERFDVVQLIGAIQKQREANDKLAAQTRALGAQSESTAELWVGAYSRMRRATDGLTDAQRQAIRFGEDMGRTLSNAFSDAIFNARNFEDVLQDLLRSLGQLAFDRTAGAFLEDLGGRIFTPDIRTRPTVYSPNAPPSAFKSRLEGSSNSGSSTTNNNNSGGNLTIQRLIIQSSGGGNDGRQTAHQLVAELNRYQRGRRN